MASQTQPWLSDRQLGAPPPRVQLRDRGELVALRARCEVLERRCEALEQALRGARGERLALGLPRHQQVMMDLLMRYPVVTVDQALAALEAEIPSRDGRSDDNAHVAMARLRVRLRARGVALHNRRFVGYWIEPADKTKLRETLR